MRLTGRKLRSLKINRGQFKMMTKAGFHVDSFSWQLPVAKRDTLIYWKRGDLRICFFRYEAVSLKTFATRLIGQTYYRTMRAAREQTVWPSADSPCFKTENPPTP